MIKRIRTANDGGFTLIELLIVIIILGILAAIVVFAVGSTRKDSVTATCKTDVKAIQLAAEAVKTKSGAYPLNQKTSDADSIIASSVSTNGAVLKSWPGGTSATDDVYLTYTYNSTGANKGGYTLSVAGKNLTGGSLTQDSQDSDVATACTSS